MNIIGCHFHTCSHRFAMLKAATGELVERRLDHESSDLMKQEALFASPARLFIMTAAIIRAIAGTAEALRHSNPAQPR